MSPKDIVYSFLLHRHGSISGSAGLRLCCVRQNILLSSWAHAKITTEVTHVTVRPGAEKVPHDLPHSLSVQLGAKVFNTAEPNDGGLDPYTTSWKGATT